MLLCFVEVTMNKLKTFVKNYWITVVIIAGAVLAYKILTD